jgi:predicted RNA polymerase sigma factor
MVPLPQREEWRDAQIPTWGQISLAEQDRTLWDQARINEGLALLNGAVGKGAVGEYRLQAAIAALHDQAHTADDTDWRQILALYGLLEQLTRNRL